MAKRNPKNNKIINYICNHSDDSITKKLELVYLDRDHDLYANYKKINYIYFPVTSIIAILNLLEDGSSPEIATIGIDGVAGIDCFFGNYCETKRLITQSSGYAYRLTVAEAINYFETDKQFQKVILKYANFLFTQASQIAACNRYHNIEEQLSRFLSTSMDRWNKNRISLTHQRIANLLGVRRPTISEASAKLSEKKIIHYHRGCVTILDQDKLNDKACECYNIIKSEADKVYIV